MLVVSLRAVGDFEIEMDMTLCDTAYLCSTIMFRNIENICYNGLEISIPLSLRHYVGKIKMARFFPEVSQSARLYCL